MVFFVLARKAELLVISLGIKFNFWKYWTIIGTQINWYEVVGA